MTSLEWSREFRGQLVNIKSTPFCIEVLGLQSRVSEEILQIYFENRRSGGERNSVSFVQNAPKVVVGFKEESGKKDISLLGILSDTTIEGVDEMIYLTLDDD